MAKLSIREKLLKSKRRVPPTHKTMLIKDIPVGLHRELKKYCSDNNKFMNKTILEAIESYIRNNYPIDK